MSSEQCPQKGMSREARAELLQGPAIQLVVSYNDSPMDHYNQLQATKGMVTEDRHRQFREQVELLERNHAQGRKTKALIEFPAHAFEAATSIACSDFTTDTSQSLELHLDLGPILPGYVMEILDWYCRSLRAREWKDFSPDRTSIEGHDKFFYLYMYIAMRKLKMHGFADQLAVSLTQYLIRQHQLTDEAGTLDYLLQHLSENDAIFEPIAERYIYLMSCDQCSLLPEQWDTITQNYPYFGRLLESYQGLRKRSDDVIQQTEDYLHDLDVSDDVAMSED